MTDDLYDNDFLKQRIKLCNKFHNEAEDRETFYVTFKRSTGAFLLDLFFGFKAVQFYFAIAFCLVLYLTAPKYNSIKLAFLLFMCLIIFCYLVRLFYKISLWRYFKYVVLSNLGIYILVNNLSGRYESFNGKKRFLINVRWSLYDWQELSQVKTYSNNISRMMRLKNITLYRWDGNEDLPYFKKEDYDKIIEMAKEKIKKKKKKKNSKTENTKANMDFFEKAEVFYMGRKDEIE